MHCKQERWSCKQKKTAIAEVANVQDEKVKLRRRFSLINILTKLGIDQKDEFKAMFFDAIYNLKDSPQEFSRARTFPVFRLRAITAIGRIILRLLNLLPWRSKIFNKYLQDFRLKSMFFNAWHNLKITPETSDTTIAFTLYRLDADIKIGKIALRLLEILPSRSNVINNYLEKFVNEKQIVDGVLQELRLHTVYAWHLANCIRTISKIAAPSIYRPVALEWINNPLLSWPQRLAAIEVLQNDQESHASLYSAIKEEKNVILKRALITACSFQAYESKSIQEVYLLIKGCFQDEDNEIKSLGIWLFRQFPSLSWADVNFQSSLGVLQPLIPEAPQAHAETPCFIKQTLRSRYGIKVKEETDFKNFFSDYNGAVLDLRKATPYYFTDPSLYIGLINSFNHRIAIELQSIIGTNIPKDQFSNLLKSGPFNSRAPQISLYFGKCNEKRSQTTGFHPYASALGAWAQSISHNEKDEIHNGLKLAYQEFVNIYENHLSSGSGSTL